jgi:hypothetical protein
MVLPDAATGNVSLTVTQLEQWGNTIGAVDDPNEAAAAAKSTTAVVTTPTPSDPDGGIIEYPITQPELQVTTTEIAIPPGAVVPTSNTTAQIITPQNTNTIPSCTTAPCTMPNSR